MNNKDMEREFDAQVESLVSKVRRYLITLLGRKPDEAYPWEIFYGVSLALREQVMINWAATHRTINDKQARRLYYISMEYLPGRMLVNNISNLSGHQIVREVIGRLGYDYNQILTLEPDPGLGNGGLGRLSACFLDSLATQQYPAIGYGLRYQYGVFEQQIWNGVQVEKPDCWLLNRYPWEIRHDGSAQTVVFGGTADGEQCGLDFEEVRALPFDYPVIGYALHHDFNVVTLRLWSTKESPHNFHLQRYNAGQIGPAAENTALTDVLYPNDDNETGKRIRLKQEFLLVSASLEDIFQRHLEVYDDLTNFADKVRIQINDTHPALIIAELMRLLIDRHHFPWERAWEMTQEVVSFTNHTILKEALEEWNSNRLSSLLPRQYRVIEQLNQQLCELVRKRYPEDEPRVERLSLIEGGQVRMAHLAILGSHKVNGVARLHGEILKKVIFKDFDELFPDKLTYVTNGVTQRHWLGNCNYHLAALIYEKIGSDWRTDFSQIKRLRDFASDAQTQREFLIAKQHNKERLVKFLHHSNFRRDLRGKAVGEPPDIALDSLFDVHAKRVHEYKRQLLVALHTILLYQELKANPDARPIKRTVIFAGKAAAGYLLAKNTIQLICAIARVVNNDPVIGDRLKVVFVENYSVTRAEIIIPAADLSEQVSMAGKEASGTGNMKFAINGALTIGTEDGANIEMHEAIKDPWWPFAFGASADEIISMKREGRYNPWDIYMTHPHIKRAVDALRDGTFSQSEHEEEAFKLLYDALLVGYGGQEADRYFVLYDLLPYYETQKRVEALYQDKLKWAEYALHNIAGMGPFSSDVSITKYAREIWGLNKLPVDPHIRQQVVEFFEDQMAH